LFWPAWGATVENFLQVAIYKCQISGAFTGCVRPNDYNRQDRLSRWTNQSDMQSYLNIIRWTYSGNFVSHLF